MKFHGKTEKIPVMGHGGGGWPGAINYNMHHLNTNSKKVNL